MELVKMEEIFSEKPKLDDHSAHREKSTHPTPTKDELQPRKKTTSNSEPQDPAPQAPSEPPKPRTWANLVGGNQDKAPQHHHQQQQQQRHQVRSFFIRLEKWNTHHIFRLLTRTRTRRKISCTLEVGAASRALSTDVAEIAITRETAIDVVERPSEVVAATAAAEEEEEATSSAASVVADSREDVGMAVVVDSTATGTTIAEATTPTDHTGAIAKVREFVDLRSRMCFERFEASSWKFLGDLDDLFVAAFLT